jgi:histidine triad (HIT) family protein
MDCIFCRIANKELPSEILLETDDLVAFRDIQPAAPVHVLIIPKAHIATLNDLESDHEELVGRMVSAAADLAKREGIEESGYRLILNCNRDGGQEVFHIHLHLLGGRSLGGLLPE